MAEIAKDAIEQGKVEETPVVEIAGAEAAPNAFAEEDAALKKLEEQAAGKTETPKPAEAKPESGEAKAVEASKSAEQGAIIALRKKTSELAAQNLVLQGQVQALTGIVKPTGEVTPTEPVVDPIEAIDQAYLAIAERVDAGELSVKEAETERLALRRQERELLRAEQAPPQTNDLGLQEHLGTLVTNYPVLNKLSQEQLLPFEQLAYQQAEMEGKPIQEGPMGTKELRERMARLAESFYDPAAAQAKTAKPKPEPAALSETAEQREAKLKLAASMPPDIGKIGAGATSGEVTEEQGVAALASFGGNEDAQIKWLEQHPQFMSKVMGRSMRLAR